MGGRWHTVGQIPKKCKETSNLMWLSLIWFILVLFVCWNLFCTIANLRIKCVTETKNVSVLFCKNLKSSFSTWLTHLTLRFLYIIGCSGPRCGVELELSYVASYYRPTMADDRDRATSLDLTTTRGAKGSLQRAVHEIWEEAWTSLNEQERRESRWRQLRRSW